MTNIVTYTKAFRSNAAGQNGITTKKYFTMTVPADTPELTQQKLAAKELYMRSCFQKIGSNIEELKA